MTDSTHTYTVEVLGTPDVALSFRGGQATLDASRAPHVQADIEVAMPDAATLALLDPRLDARVRVTSDAVFPTTTQHREFDLCLLTRPVRHQSATVTLRLASDEAILFDKRAMADDDTPLGLQGSLRDIVNYALGEAIPGAELEPGPDADATRYWAVTNRVQNPLADSTAGYSGGSTATLSTGTSRTPVVGVRYVVWTATAGAPAFLLVDGDRNVTPGERYTFKAHVGEGTGASAGIYVRFSWVNDNGVTIKQESSPVADFTTSGLDPIEFSAVAPVGAATISVHVVGVATSAGQAFALDAPILYEGPFDVPFFYGGTADDADYTYSFGGTENASSSHREPVVERHPEALIWRAEQSAMDFLGNLVQAYGLRLVCDEQRQWTLREAEHLEPGTLDIRVGVNLTDATDTLSREDYSTFFDAAVTVHEWTDRHGIRQRRVDAFALNDPYTRCVLFERDTPYPGPGFSEYAVRRAQGRGRVVEASKVADWRARAEQSCAFYVPGADPQTGKTDRVVFDFDNDEVYATARTTDTPEGAWLLGDEDEEWLDTPDGSWLEE